MTFLTVEGNSEGIYKEKKSKFLSFVIKCHTLDEVDNHIKLFKKKYNDARHIVWAFRFYENDIHDYWDDGEPGGTAGVNIFNTIKSYNLYNVLIIVVRYFGGIKLGVRGLIDAYKNSVIDALNQNKIVEEEYKIKMCLEYDQTNGYKVMDIFKKNNIPFELDICDEKFKISVSLSEGQCQLLDKVKN